MSGHSKWATIHRQKEAKDARRGAAFTKLAAAITVAVKQGGGVGNPEENFRLRIAVDKARQANMPKDNISRAIEKGVGKAGLTAVSEVTFEGFLPGGAAVLVEAVTDNKLRTAQEVRQILDKNGGSLAGAGAVGYLFSPLGEIVADIGTGDMQTAQLLAIDAGVRDIEDLGEGKLLLFCDREKLFEVRQKILKEGWKIESAEMVMRPVNMREIDDPIVREKIEKIVDILGDIEGVAHIWSDYA